jgi:L-aspartate oxidase
LRQRVRQIMSARVAIVRQDEGLAEARTTLEQLESEFHDLTRSGAASVELHACRQALTLASLTVASACTRRESRGLHYNPDCARHADPTPQPSRQIKPA